MEIILTITLIYQLAMLIDFIIYRMFIETGFLDVKLELSENNNTLPEALF